MGRIYANDDAKKIDAIIALQGEVTLKYLVSHLSLSRPTVWRRVRELLDKGMVEQIGHTRGARYRRRKESPEHHPI